MNRPKELDANVPFPYVCRNRICKIIGTERFDDDRIGFNYIVQYPDLTVSKETSDDVKPNWKRPGE